MPRCKTSFVRFGVIGLGGMGQGHCRIIARVPRARLAAVCDSDVCRAREIGEQFGAPYFKSVRELVMSETCDVALIATPHPQHFSPALACLNAGLHVLCEKPLTERLSTARKIVAVARRRRLALAVMLQCRFEPAFRSALALVSSGDLGRLRRAEMRWSDYRTQAYYDSAPWRGTWRGEGGGVLLNQAPHMLDLFLQLTGLPYEVSGRAETLMHRIEVEDYADALLRYRCGAMGYLACSTNDPTSARYISLWMDKGVLLYRPDLPITQRLTLDRYDNDLPGHILASEDVWGRIKTHQQPIRVRNRAWGQDSVVSNMVRHLLDSEDLVCSGSGALASIELAHAIVLSAWRQQPSAIPVDTVKYDKILARRRRAAPVKKPQKATRRVTDPALVAK